MVYSSRCSSQIMEVGVAGAGSSCWHGVHSPVTRSQRIECVSVSSSVAPFTQLRSQSENVHTQSGEDHPTSVNADKITLTGMSPGLSPRWLRTSQVDNTIHHTHNFPHPISLPSSLQRRYHGDIFKAERFLLLLSHKLKDAKDHPGYLVPPVPTWRKNKDRMNTGIAKRSLECAISPSRL